MLKNSEFKLINNYVGQEACISFFLQAHSHLAIKLGNVCCYDNVHLVLYECEYIKLPICWPFSMPSFKKVENRFIMTDDENNIYIEFGGYNIFKKYELVLKEIISEVL